MIINSKKRSFGIGSKVSAFTLGTMRLTESPEKMYEIIKLAHLAGINHLETAPSYGKAELFLGDSLNKLERIDNIPKQKWIITTKVLPTGGFKDLKINFLNSLANLNLTKVNNLAIHGINLYDHLEWSIAGEGKRFIDWIKDMGFAEQIGFSSHGSYQLISDSIDSDFNPASTIT